MTKVTWQITKSTNWSWIGAKNNNFTQEPDVLEATVDVPPNSEFWWVCQRLVLERTIGTAGFRYWQDNSGSWIQVYTDASGAWTDTGEPGNLSSSTGATGRSGGISLTALIDQ